MLTLDKIREALQDRRPSVVAEAVGLRVATVIDLRDGRTTNPTYATVKALSDYLSPSA